MVPSVLRQLREPAAEAAEAAEATECTSLFLPASLARSYRQPVAAVPSCPLPGTCLVGLTALLCLRAKRGLQYIFAGCLLVSVAAVEYKLYQNCTKIPVAASACTSTILIAAHSPHPPQPLLQPARYPKTQSNHPLFEIPQPSFLPPRQLPPP